MPKEEIRIEVRGRVGVGKTGVCDVIRKALKAHYGNVEVIAKELDSDLNQLSELQHPHPDNITFVIVEEHRPL